MRIPDGPGGVRPAITPRPAREQGAGAGSRAARGTADSFEVAPQNRWTPTGFRAHLPPEDLAAARPCPPPPAPRYPALAGFLDEHPEIRTNQDFINHWLDQGGWSALARGCDELGITTGDVTNYRSAAIRDLVSPPPPPDGSLPLTAEEANRFHIVQFTNPTYNPTGPAASKNCGPASLAMALDSQGRLPAGLTPEQKVDYARALMFPDSSAIETIEVGGVAVPQLDQDGVTTGTGAIETGAEEAGLPAEVSSGWDELDQALRDGKPIVAFGDCYEAWKQEFPDRTLYGGGEIGHFVAILGMTVEGAYIVSDPMYRGGAVEMTRDQLAVYFDKDGDNTPGFVAIEGAGEKPTAPVEDVPVRLLRGRYQVE